MEIYDDDPSNALLKLDEPEWLIIHGDIDGSRDNAWSLHEFCARLERLPGRDAIRGVQVGYFSHLQDCQILRYFPKAESVFALGREMRSLRGIAGLGALRHVRVNSGKGNRIDLDELPGSTATSLKIYRPRSADLAAINPCLRLTALDLYGSDPTPFAQLQSTRLESLDLIRNNMKEIVDLGLLGTVTKLYIGYSRTLCGVSCPLPNVRSLTLESCGKFDVATLASFPNLRYLRISGATLPFNLSDLSGLVHLNDLTVACAKLNREKEVLSGFPSLNRLWMNPVRDDFTAHVGVQLPQARVCNGGILTLGGIPQKDIQPYYEEPKKS